MDTTSVKPLTINHTYTYLCIEIGSIDNTNNKLDTPTTLLLISKVFLNLQLQFDLFTFFLVPSMLHQLTFSNIYINSLITMDILIRSFAWRSLRLPKDTSLDVFYAPCVIGCLSIYLYPTIFNYTCYATNTN